MVTDKFYWKNDNLLNSSCHMKSPSQLSFCHVTQRVFRAYYGTIRTKTVKEIIRRNALCALAACHTSCESLRNCFLGCHATGFAWHSNANVFLEELAAFWFCYWQSSLTMKKKGTQLTRFQFCCLILFSTKLSIRKYLYRYYFVNHCSCISLMIWNHPNNDKLIFCIVISFNHSR